MRFFSWLFATTAAFLFVGATHDARAQFTFASDNGGNSAYSDGWQSGDNGGSGFNAWIFNNGANSGEFIGSPAGNGMGTTGIGTSAFGVYSTQNGQYYNAYRQIAAGMGIGDAFSFWWAMAWDTGANGLNKGIALKAGTNDVIAINNNGTSPNITVNAINSNFGYGTTPMLVTVTRTSGTQYSFSMSPDRDGTGSYSVTINSTSAIDGFNIYGSNNTGDGARNVYYNNFANYNTGVFTQGGTVINASRFTSTGNLSVDSNTTLALTGSGNNNYTGSTTIGSGSTLRFEGAGTSDFASAISGAGNVFISNSAGVLNLIGNNSGLTGAITVSSGILEARSANSLGSTAAGPRWPVAVPSRSSPAAPASASRTPSTSQGSGLAASAPLIILGETIP